MFDKGIEQIIFIKGDPKLLKLTFDHFDHYRQVNYLQNRVYNKLFQQNIVKIMKEFETKLDKS